MSEYCVEDVCYLGRVEHSLEVKECEQELMLCTVEDDGAAVFFEQREICQGYSLCKKKF